MIMMDKSIRKIWAIKLAYLILWFNEKNAMSPFYTVDDTKLHSSEWHFIYLISYII